MKFQVLRGFCLGGGVDLYPGQIAEIPETIAPLYLRQGRIEPVGAESDPAITGDELIAKASRLAAISLAESVDELNELVPADESDQEVIAAYQLRTEQFSGEDL